MSEKTNNETENVENENNQNKNTPKLNENTYLDKMYNLYTRVDTSIDLGLEKTDSIVTDLYKVLNSFFKFLKKSLTVKTIKKVLFFLFMSMAMAFVFTGINLIFGKIIL
jgi:hypothetical protein